MQSILRFTCSGFEGKEKGRYNLFSMISQSEAQLVCQGDFDSSLTTFPVSLRPDPNTLCNTCSLTGLDSSKAEVVFRQAFSTMQIASSRNRTIRPGIEGAKKATPHDCHTPGQTNTGRQKPFACRRVEVVVGAVGRASADPSAAGHAVHRSMQSPAAIPAPQQAP